MAMKLLGALRYLVALHEHRHFGRAAQACHITQPALSNALRALEEEFGVVIVQRGRAFAGFTPEGERVLASARAMLHEDELLRQALNSEADRPAGRIAIGAVPTAIPIAARFAAMLQARHPGIVPTVRSMSSPGIEAALDDLSLDLALGYTERPAQLGLRASVLSQVEERYFLLRRRVAPSTPGLQMGSPIGWAEAARQPLCLLTPEMHNRSLVDGAFATAGARPQPAMETNSILTLTLAVAAGDLCSVLPGALLTAAPADASLQAYPLTGPELSTPVGFMTAQADRPSRTLAAALALAADASWLSLARTLAAGRVDLTS